MIRKIDVASCLGAVALLFGGVSASAATLGDVANMARLTLLEGDLDFSVTPFPVRYTFSSDQIFTTPAGSAIAESIDDQSIPSALRSASVSVSPGIIKTFAASAGIRGGHYVQGAAAEGYFIDTFSIQSSARQWIPVTFRLYVDGKALTTGGPNNFNRAGVAGLFELTSALGGQQGGKRTTVLDWDIGARVFVDPCIATASQETCGFVRGVGRNSDTDFDGYEFTYQAIVKTNEAFTLQVGIASGAYSLAPNEWSVSDFASTAIFGGIEVGTGVTVTSLGTGGTLGMKNGRANYDAAFAALVDKYGTATPGAVPEPGIWAMMIAGFAMAGGVLRRRAPIRVDVALSRS